MPPAQHFQPASDVVPCGPPARASSGRVGAHTSSSQRFPAKEAGSSLLNGPETPDLENLTPARRLPPCAAYPICPLPVILWKVAHDLRRSCNRDLHFPDRLTGCTVGGDCGHAHRAGQLRHNRPAAASRAARVVGSSRTTSYGSYRPRQAAPGSRGVPAMITLSSRTAPSGPTVRSVHQRGAA